MRAPTFKRTIAPARQPTFRLRNGPVAAVLLFLALMTTSARAQFTIDWYTVDGGGASSSGGAFTITGTIGQPDAGILGGGKLVGGFWSLTAPLPPVLTIIRSGANAIISWPSPSTGFVLQQNNNLSTATWNNVVQVPSDNGLFKSVTVPASGALYYRLSNP